MGVVAAVGDAIAAISAAFGTAGAGIAGGIGLGDATLGGLSAGSLIGSGLEGATLGAGLGGIEGAVTGQPILQDVGLGALGGGLTGGLGPAVGGLTGLGTIGGDALTGAGAGALTGAIGGTSPLTGALTGGAGGAISGALSGGLGSDSTGGSGGGPTSTTGVGTGGSASGTAAPAGAGASGGDALTLASTSDAAPSSPLDLSSVGGASSAVPSSGSYTPPTDPSAAVFNTTTGAPVDPSAIPSLTNGAPPSTSSLYNSIFGGTGTPNLVDASGNYTLPPPAQVAPGSAVVDPTTGALLSPGASGYDAAVSSLNTAPTVAAPAGADASTGGIGSFLKSYGAPLVAASGLGLDLLKGSTPVAGQSQLTSEAGQLASQGATLQSYLQSGTLPPGVQNSITSAADAAKAAIRSRYAQMGGDTSAMQQDLANVDQTAATQGASIATQLLSQGVSETGLSEQIYASLMNQATQQNAQLGSAIGNLATSLAGRPGILQLQTSST